MKRIVFILLVSMALTASGPPFADPAAEASPGPTITVDTSAGTSLPDDVMTLREAMLLARGELTLADLAEGECDQVAGAAWWGWPAFSCFTLDPDAVPGADSSDTIVFDTGVFPPHMRPTIALFSPLPPLDMGGDTVDASAAGVIIRGRHDVGDDFDCFTITSSGNTIKGLEIYHCNNAIRISGAGPPGNNTIGGDGPGERNVLSSNFTGVFIDGADGNVVTGNLIGINASATAASPNVRGVHIDLAHDTTVNKNAISGNEMTGISIFGSEHTIVTGNVIGTDPNGTAVLPNGGAGVLIGYGAENNTIGGIGSDDANVIAFNNGDGVWVDGEFGVPTRNAIRGNSIHSNGGEGIENEDGGNEELDPPAITGFGSVRGTACPNCTVDVYSDDEDEGRVYEGSTTADGDGNWSALPGWPDGPNVTATATDSDGNTSEFSEPMAVPEPTATPSPTPSPTPTPTATPGATPTPAGPTRTLQWNPGWHNATWSGASTPEEAFACAAGKYAAAYRFTDAGLERYFPDRPDISNMNPLAQFDAFLILITQPVTCTMPVTAASGSSRTLQWGAGWQNEGWSGADGTAPQDAFACADGSYAAAYRFTEAGLERYFPNRPDISNMGPLNKYDAFLILATAPVSCSMPVAP